MSNLAFVYGLIVVAAVLVFWAVQWRRRVQARRTADQLGGQLTTSYPAASFQAPVAGPPVAGQAAGAQTGAQTEGQAAGGQAVRLQVAGRPATAWQAGGDAYADHGVRLSLRVEYGAGLPVLTMFHHSQVIQTLLDHPATKTGIDALDQTFRCSGELDVWRPILANPAVQQALLSFPLNSVFVLGGQIALESLDGVHLEPRTTEGLLAVATALVSAIPPTVTSAGATPSPSAALGPDLTDVDSLVRNAMSRSGLSPEQQEAMLALVRANQHGRG